MKKILFVVDNLSFGGVEKSLVDLIKVLSKSKVQIDLFLFQNEGIYLNEVNNLVRVKTIPKNEQIFLMSYKKALKILIKEKRFLLLIDYIIKIITSIFSFKYKKYSLGNRLRFKIIDNLNIKLNGYDIAVAYSARHLLYFTNNFVSSKEKITYIHGDLDNINLNIYELKEFYEKMDKIICVSNKSMDSFLKILPHLKNKTIVINNLIDYELIDKLKDEKVNEFDQNYLNIVSVGRLEKEKNYLWLVQTFKQILEKQNNKVRLYIIGDGSERKKINKFIKRNNLENKVFMLGYQKNPYKYIDKANIYVQPSLSEGFCLTVYEAYYLKKVILTNDFADIRSLIKDNYDGFIALNEKDFINKLANIIKNDHKNIVTNIKKLSNEEVLNKINQIYLR